MADAQFESSGRIPQLNEWTEMLENFKIYGIVWKNRKPATPTYRDNSYQAPNCPKTQPISLRPILTAFARLEFQKSSKITIKPKQTGFKRHGLERVGIIIQGQRRCDWWLLGSTTTHTRWTSLLTLPNQSISQSINRRSPVEQRFPQSPTRIHCSSSAHHSPQHEE